MTADAKEQEPREVIAGGATRVLTPGVVEALQRFQDRTLIEAGAICLLTLEPVAEGLGSRWPLQRGKAERLTEQLLAAEVQGDGAFLKVSETDYILSRPELSSLAAQVSCLRLLKEILRRFMGNDSRAAAGLYRVTAISEGQIEAQSVEPDQLLAEYAREEVERERADALAAAKAPFVASDGRTVRVACDLQPVIQLKNSTAIGYRLARRVVLASNDEELPAAEIADLAGVDILKIDRAAATQGIARIREEHADAPPPTLILPVSYVSLAGQRGRTEIVAAIQEARRCATHGVICEVYGIDGAPHATLHEVVSILRPLALFVVGKPTMTIPLGAGQFRGVGFRALAFECPPKQDDAEFLGWATGMVALGKRAASAVLFYGAANDLVARRLAELGASHVSLSAA